MMAAGGGRNRPERFHGAFTGGFSAGFFNTVGTAEGWKPSSFTSSRDKRAEYRQQRPEDYMDDEDGLLNEQLQAKPQFDMLGSTASDMAKRQAQQESTGSIIPGPAPSELVVPVGEAMGNKLLRTMGWKEGQGVGARVRRRRKPVGDKGGDGLDVTDTEEVPASARQALGAASRSLLDNEGGISYAPRDTAREIKPPPAKTDLCGVGHDPFKNAPEFKAARNGRGSAWGAQSDRPVYRTRDLLGSGAGGGKDPAAGTGGGASQARGTHGFALDDDDDDVYGQGDGMEAYDNAVEIEPADGGTGARLGTTALATSMVAGGDVEDPALPSRRYARCPLDGSLPPPGFVVAVRPDFQQKNWPPPEPPADYVPEHEFETGSATTVDSKTVLQSNPAQGGLSMTAVYRARLLGEERRHTPPTALPDHAARPGSVFGLVSERDRLRLQQLAGAKRTQGSGARSGGGEDVNAAPGEASHVPQQVAGLKAALASRFASEGSSHAQAQRPETQHPGMPSVLANRFTAASSDGSSRKFEAGDTRAGGLAIPKLSSSTESRSGLSAEQGQSDKTKEPVRTTRHWRPAPLLCKRFNVPVPQASKEADWGSKAQAGGAAAAARERDDRDLLHRNMGQHMAPHIPKPLLQGMEVTPAGGPPSLSERETTQASEEASADSAARVKKPPIDLFKSIFEPESESDEEAADGSAGEEENGEEEGEEVVEEEPKKTSGQTPEPVSAWARMGHTFNAQRESSDSSDPEPEGLTKGDEGTAQQVERSSDRPGHHSERDADRESRRKGTHKEKSRKSHKSKKHKHKRKSKRS